MLKIPDTEISMAVAFTNSTVKNLGYRVQLTMLNGTGVYRRCETNARNGDSPVDINIKQATLWESAGVDNVPIHPGSLISSQTRVVDPSARRKLACAYIGVTTKMETRTAEVQKDC